MRQLIDSLYLLYRSPAVKEGIVKALLEEAQGMLGMSMTFTLIEWLKDNQTQYLEQQDIYYQDMKNSIAAKDITADVEKINLDGNQEVSIYMNY